jgi:hypothetical protein
MTMFLGRNVIIVYNPDQGGSYPPQGSGIGDACNYDEDVDPSLPYL